MEQPYREPGAQEPVLRISFKDGEERAVWEKWFERIVTEQMRKPIETMPAVDFMLNAAAVADCMIIERRNRLPR